jgi:ABC-type dipeptide/oligopeptide/nickel transport system permease subunit
MMVTAGLGFLGYYIGGDVWIEVGDFVSRRVSGMPELGQMLATSWTTLTEPWPMVLTGTVIFMIILGFNLFGEGLRLRLDPERVSRNSPLARATRSATWWLEQQIIHPMGS